jgi:hypothetical protein
MQLYLIKSLTDEFGEEVANLCNYGTLFWHTEFKIGRPDNADKVDAEM